MKEITKFLLRLLTHFLLRQNTSNQTMATMMNTIMGSRAERNSFRNTFAGKGPFISLSVTKQSNERNVSDDDPTLFAGRNILFNTSG